MHAGGIVGHESIGLVMFVTLWAAHARADEPFECIARKQGVRQGAEAARNASARIGPAPRRDDAADVFFTSASRATKS